MAVGAGSRIETARGGLLNLRFGDAVAPMQENGQAWLRIGRHEPERFVVAHEVLERKVNPEKIRDKVILVGINGLGVLDFKTTPLGEFVPGVEIHAQVIENIFNGVSLTRPAIAPRLEAAARSSADSLPFACHGSRRCRASTSPSAWWWCSPARGCSPSCTWAS